MKAVESRAEVFLMALQSLSRTERETVLTRLLDDPRLREDILDLALLRQRQAEPSRPFAGYLAERRESAATDAVEARVLQSGGENTDSAFELPPCRGVGNR